MKRTMEDLDKLFERCQAQSVGEDSIESLITLLNTSGRDASVLVHITDEWPGSPAAAFVAGIRVGRMVESEESDPTLTPDEQSALSDALASERHNIRDEVNAGEPDFIRRARALDSLEDKLRAAGAWS